MGLEEMLSRIKVDTEEQYNKIISSAKTESEKIIQEAKQTSEKIISLGKVQAEKEAQDEKLRLVASARLEAKRKLLEARDVVLRSYEDQAFRYADEFTNSNGYKEFLLRVVEDGISKIGTDSVIHVNSKDRNLLQTDRKLGYKISDEPLNCKGGALIISADGKKRVDNTIESIFNERKDELRLKLFEQVFRN